MHEQKPFQHVTQAELRLSTSELLARLREAMTTPGSDGKTVEDQAKLVELQVGAPEHEIQVLENCSKQYFDFLAKLLERKSSRSYKFKDLQTGSDIVLNIYPEVGGLRAIFSYGGKHIDLTFLKERDDTLVIKQHLGGDRGTRKHPEGADPYKNNFDFTGPNLKYLSDELSALSAVLDAVDDFRVDIS